MKEKETSSCIITFGSRELSIECNVVIRAFQGSVRDSQTVLYIPYTILLSMRGCEMSAMLMKMSSAGWRYSGARRRFWSKWWPMKPMERPSTKRPLSVPICVCDTELATLLPHGAQATYLDVLVSLFWRESTTIAEQVDEADGNTAIDVEDELVVLISNRNMAEKNKTKTNRILLRCRHLLDRERIIKQAVTGEVLVHILLHELNSEIRVVDALDLVANAGDCTRI